MARPSDPRQVDPRSVTSPSTEHREVVPAAQGCLFTSSVSLCVLAIFLIICLVASMSIGPVQFSEMFEDYDAQLPALTVWVLGTPTWLSILLGTLLAAALIVKEVFIHQHLVNLILNLIVLMFLFVWGTLLIVAMWLPVAALIESQTN